MGYRVRLVVEYDLDVDGELTPETLAEIQASERRDWLAGHVEVADVAQVHGEDSVSLEIISVFAVQR